MFDSVGEYDMDPYQQQQPTVGGQPQLPANPGMQPGAVSGGGAATTTPSAPKNMNSTQNSLIFSEFRDGMVIMNDGSFRAIIDCESINFDLMSSREREGVEYTYQSFLNSLYFPVQIVVRSQRVDIGPYLDRLIRQRRSQDNMLLGVLMDDYIGFIDAVARETNIMDKRFYIVVPYFSTGDLSALASAGKSIFTVFQKQQEQTARIQIDQATYTKARDELSNRTSAVMSGLFQMGVKAHQLNTQELSELFYNSYNPDTAVRQPLRNFEQQSTYVQKGQGVPPGQQVDHPFGGV